MKLCSAVGTIKEEMEDSPYEKGIDARRGERGYEIESFKTIYEQPLVDNADWYLVAHSVKNLNKLKEKE